VIDNKTGKEPDLEDIALNEKWAFDLVHCDMEGFAITDNGDLIMLDECGNYEFCPEGRFTVSQENVLDKIRAEINSPNRGTCDYFIVDRIEEIIDKYKAESEKGAKE
jgi:hypothetical protein